MSNHFEMVESISNHFSVRSPISNILDQCSPPSLCEMCADFYTRSIRSICLETQNALYDTRMVPVNTLSSMAHVTCL